MDWMMNLLGVVTAFAEEAGVSAEAAEGAVEGVETTSTLAAWLQLLLPMVVVFGLMYFVLIRPQRKKDKQVQDMLANLKVGDRICTIGGIYGTITAVKDDDFTLAVGNKNMPIVVARWAIRSVEDKAVENDAEALN